MSKSAVAFFGRGLHARFTGDTEAAIADFVTAIRLLLNRQRTATPAYRLFRAAVQAELARAQGQLARSQVWTSTALALAEVFSDRYTQATLLIDQGCFLIQEARIADVHVSYLRLIALVDEIHIPHIVERCRFFERYLLAHGALGSPPLLMIAATSQVHDTLSSRECEVLKLVAAGHTNREIATILVISQPTVKKHLEHIYAHLGVHSRTAALAKAKTLHIIP